jgi:uncharacterized membrane protein (UPF0136 family)
MKTIVTVLVPPLVGLLVGGLLGYVVVGAKAKNVAILAGTCSIVDLAVKEKILTPDQAEKLGLAMAKQVNVKDSSGFVNNNSDAGEGCQRAFKGIVQAAK